MRKHAKTGDRKRDWTPAMRRDAVELLIRVHEVLSDADEEYFVGHLVLLERINALLDRLI